jgi:hypothetical protein
MKDFSKTAFGHSLMVAGYLGLSAAVGYLVTLTTNQPAIFGMVYTPFINYFLVLAEKLLDPEVKNI